MDDRIHMAVENNARWCDLVCRSHGITASWLDGFWVSRQPSPKFYPAGITLQENVSPKHVVDELPAGICSVKDSFADLDIASHGFELLLRRDGSTGTPRLAPHLQRAGRPSAPRGISFGGGRRVA
jgi:hypothetical protein